MRRFGLTVALVASLDGCIDDPTFVQSDGGDAGGSSSSSSSASSSSSGGPTGRCNPSTCGGTCDGDTCVIACPGSGGCGDNVRCPAGADCKVTCGQKNQCKRVTCSGGATKCTVACSGSEACGEVIIDSPASTLTCDGKDACGKVDCRGTSCAVTCTGQACEPKDVKCCASSCTLNGMKGECK